MIGCGSKFCRLSRVLNSCACQFVCLCGAGMAKPSFVYMWAVRLAGDTIAPLFFLKSIFRQAAAHLRVLVGSHQKVSSSHFK